MLGKVMKDVVRCQCICCKDGFCDFFRGYVVFKEYDFFLCQKVVNEDDNWMGVDVIGCEMGMESKWLWGFGVCFRKVLDQFDEGEVVNSFWYDCCGNFDWNWYVFVYDFVFEFVCILWNSVGRLFFFFFDVGFGFCL